MKQIALRGFPGRRQGGFTLIELMAALVVGLILMGGILQIFISSKNAYTVQEGLARLQENGRFALDLLSRDIRMAGYMGCPKLVVDPATQRPRNLTSTLNSAELPYHFAVGLEGFDGASGYPAYLLSQLGEPPRAGTDAIVVRSVISEAIPVLVPNNATTVYTALTGSLQAGDLLAIADCAKVRVFQAGSITGTGSMLAITHPATGVPGNNPAAWGGAGDQGDGWFDAGAEVYPVQTRLYYIRRNPDSIPALYLKAGVGSPVELITGVADMQIRYGVDLAEPDGAVNQYLTAAGVTAASAWPRVISVHLSLLLQTDNNLAETPQPYVFNGVTVTPPANDRRLRRTFATVITRRNRAF